MFYGILSVACKFYGNIRTENFLNGRLTGLQSSGTMWCFVVINTTTCTTAGVEFVLLGSIIATVPGRPANFAYRRTRACCACSRCGTGGLYFLFIVFFYFPFLMSCLLGDG